MGPLLLVPPPKKYELTDETITIQGHKLYRIRSLFDPDVFGGFIESESNLSHEGRCWVDYNAIVYGDATISGDAQILDRAIVNGSSRIMGHAKIYGNARISGDFLVAREAHVYGNAFLSGSGRVLRDSRIFGDARISGKYICIINSMIFDNSEIYGRCRIIHSTICDNAKIFNSHIYKSKICDDAILFVTHVQQSATYKPNVLIRCHECNCELVETTLESYTKNIEWYDEEKTPYYCKVYDCANDEVFELGIYDGKPYCECCLGDFF